MFKDMLKDIVCAYGPSGRESAVRGVIKKYLEGKADSITVDALGNLIALKKGTSNKKVMLCAHMDQIGFVVIDIDDKGFLRFAPVGGVGALSAYARSVTFASGVSGVIDAESKDFQLSKMSLANMYIDIGAASKAEAENLVSIGDMAVYTPLFREMGDETERYSCASMDNRACCAVMLEVFLKAKSQHDIYAVFSVQEEVGLRGSKTAAYAIEPNFGLNFDVTGSGDTPNSSPLAVSLGNGAAIKVMDRSVIVPPAVRDFLIESAKEAGAKYQMEVLPYGGTDTASIQQSRGGVLAGCISVPCRYIHSAHEVVDASDLQAAVAVAVKALEKGKLPSCL